MDAAVLIDTSPCIQHLRTREKASTQATSLHCRVKTLENATPRVRSDRPELRVVEKSIGFMYGILMPPSRPHMQAANPAPLFPALRRKGFQIQMISHAEAILRHDMGTAANEIEAVFSSLTIPVLELVKGGGGEAQATQ